MKVAAFCLFLFVVLGLNSFASNALVKVDTTLGSKILIEDANYSWADSVFYTLTTDERIAQLFMVPAYSNKDKKHQEAIAKLICDYKIGGLIFFQGGPIRQANLTNYYQSLSKVPLMITIDGEWGLAMRLDSTYKFPRQQMLGALKSDTLVYKMGKEIANHCDRLGIQVNFAPVIDVNNNPANPVISNRSFGENKWNVTSKGLAYMKGMQDSKVLATGKHFPGHGDTESDSHLTLPIISHPMGRIDTLELFPFRKLFAEGLMSTMVAHLYIPSLDSTANTASTLSKNVVTDLLKNDLKYKGLIFTDALNMKGVAKYYEPGIVDVKAVLSGNDVLLNAEDVPKGIEQIKEAMYTGQIRQEDIDTRCLKILRAKQWSNMNNLKRINLKNITNDLNPSSSELLNRQIIQNAITVLKNEDKIIPFKNLDTLKLLCIAVNEKNPNQFQQIISNYSQVKQVNLTKSAKIKDIDSVLAIVPDYDYVITGLFNVQSKPEGNFGMPDFTVSLIDTLNKLKPNIIINFGNAYAFTKLKNVNQAKVIIESYEDNTNTEQITAQLLFGQAKANGRLPVSVPPYFKAGEGMDVDSLPGRLQYVIPEEIGLTAKQLQKIDSIALTGIKAKAYPGCQIVAIKNGKVFYQKSFGNYTYETNASVTNNSIYDLASVTKTAASCAAVMKLYDEGKIDLDKTVSYYLPETDSTNKGKIVLRDMLTHQAGLVSWLPFWKNTVDGDSLRSDVYSEVPSDTFALRVAEGIYENKFFVDSIYKSIYDSPLGDKTYKYSDLGYYFIKRIVENITKQSLDVYVTENFYKPLGLWSMRYNPRKHFDLEQMVPTEFDAYFRHQLLQGDVHDQGAAMLGGVGGHAGLFSNAIHLATLFQMYMNNGSYAGKQFIKASTIKEFTCCQHCEKGNRRGLCFDKPEGNKQKESPTCASASINSFGHSGFTGTYAWADPDKQLVYVFLSNRVHPDAENKKITQLGIRTNIQEYIYSLFK